MVISASLQACGVVFPFAMPTSICRSIVTICSGLYLLIGMTRFSSKWILSHSTWYKLCRSRQPAAFVGGESRVESPTQELCNENSHRIPEVPYENTSGLRAPDASGGRNRARERSARGDGSGLGHAHYGWRICERQ